MNPWIAFGLGFLAAWVLSALFVLVIIGASVVEAKQRRGQRQRERLRIPAASSPRRPIEVRLLHVAGESEAEIAERLLGMLT